jgi:hypothetical protein
MRNLGKLVTSAPKQIVVQFGKTYFAIYKAVNVKPEMINITPNIYEHYTEDTTARLKSGAVLKPMSKLSGGRNLPRHM